MKRITRFYQGEQGRIVWHSPDNRAIAEFDDDGRFETQDERVIGILQTYKYKSETILMDEPEMKEPGFPEMVERSRMSGVDMEMKKPEVPKQEPVKEVEQVPMEEPVSVIMPDGGYSEEVYDPEMDEPNTEVPMDEPKPEKKKPMKRGS